MARLGSGAVFGLVIACGPVVGGDGDGDDSAGGSSTTSQDPTTFTSSFTTVQPTDPTGVDASSSDLTEPTTTPTPETTDDPDTGNDTAVFLDPDTSCFAHCTFSCDVWLQDCPDGEKCSAWANDGGVSWNDTRCSPVEPDPDQPGEPCTVEGSGVSGIDTCALGAMCWDVDPDTNTGTCVALCTGSSEAPQCADACERCLVTNEEVLNLCLPLCAPFGDDCAPGQVCAMFGNGFQCLPGAGYGGAGVGEVCTATAECDPGLVCTSAAELPACEGPACCTPWCDVANPESCAEVPGTACVELDAGVDGCTPATGSCVVVQ